MGIFKIFQDELIHSLWNLLGAVAILIIGWAVAILIEVITMKALNLTRFKLIKISTVSKSMKFLIIIFSVMMALEQLNVAKATILSTYQIVLGTIGLALGLAAGISFGLAGQDFARDFIKSVIEKKK